jgi:predicted dehydrogenase
MTKQRIGIIGIGKISGVYLKNLTGMFGKRVTVNAVADIVRERALVAAKEYNIPHVYQVDELLKSPEVDIVLNLTIPKSHYEICRKAIEAGKHVYTEKPLSVRKEDGVELLRLAKRKQVYIGGAPDTFLGAGIQTCGKLIDDGWIGRPIAATAFMMNHGHEHWHPAPEFYYKPGAGPMFDMGPYYLTALVSLLGPVVRVSGSAKIGMQSRVVTSEPLAGQTIKVEVPTHIAGILDFASGAIGTIITSFDVYAHSLPFIEIYGTEGTLRMGDPDYFCGPVWVCRGRSQKWSEIPLLGNYRDNSRGLGITDMAEGISEGRPCRASGDLCFHILEIMHGIHEASESGNYYQVKGTCTRPEPLAINLLSNDYYAI